MSQGLTLSSVVLAAKTSLQEGQQKLHSQHAQGSPGIQVCAKLTDLADTVVGVLFTEAISDLAQLDQQTFGDLEDQVALVAHGGYGRRELAPFSDIDLMILHRTAVTEHVSVLAERLLRDLSDTGLIVGHSLRTTRQALALSLEDPHILTSLIESRHVCGNVELTERLLGRLRKLTHRHARGLLPVIDDARREERRQYGETVYLLEPNIKRSRGGLRDIQLLRWIGFCMYGTSDPNGLALKGVLEKDEQVVLRNALEFLLRTRNEAHFDAGKAKDQLDRAEQMRLAETFGYRGTEGMLSVEQFMQEYFQHTVAVRYISTRFFANAYQRSRLANWLSVLFSHRVAGDFRVGPYRISATPRGMERIGSDLSEVLRLAELSALYDKRISHETWEAVRKAASSCTEVSRETIARFLSLLSRPPQLPRILARLHEMGVLEKFIPAFARARGMLQFNEYHKYTVDEHCLLAVRRAIQFAQQPGPLGEVYLEIEQKEILHLALLVHDLGKGYVEDHSDVGKRIAGETAIHLGLSQHQTEMLEFLVHKHLLMSRAALWHDINDPAVMQSFVVEVGSPEVLRMLYVLTAADMAAVGPDVLNDWKIELLTQFYKRAMKYLTGGDTLVSDEGWARKQREKISAIFGDCTQGTTEIINSLSVTYLRGTTPEQVVEALHRVQDLDKQDVDAWGLHYPDRGVTEFTVAAHLSLVPGTFYRLAGALASEGVEVLSAQINTLSTGWALDRFHGIDTEYDASSSDQRIEKVCDRLVQSLKHPSPDVPKFRRIWNKQDVDKATLSGLPTRVLFDNVTSDRATILQVFAPDRLGLLYTAAKKIHDLQLGIVAAKIGTYIDQVVDVFYVTDTQGKKIVDEARLQSACDTLLETLEEFEAECLMKY